MGKTDDLFDTPAGAIKVYEPAMKNPDDQLVWAQEQIFQLGKAPIIPMQQIAAPEDVVSLFTGLAGVTDTGNAAALNSTGPQRIEEGPSQTRLLLIGAGIFALIYNFLGGKT